MIKKPLLITLFINILWLLGIGHILYHGSRPYRHYRYEDLVNPDFSAVMMTCGLFSLFFIIYNLMKIIPVQRINSFWLYIFLSAVLLFQTFIAFIGAMHSPPYWGAFILNSMILLLVHFIFIPLTHLILWLGKRKNTTL